MKKLHPPLSEEDTNKICSLIETMINNPNMTYIEAIRATPIDKIIECNHDFIKRQYDGYECSKCGNRITYTEWLKLTK